MAGIKTYCRIKPADNRHSDCDVTKEQILLRLGDGTHQFKFTETFDTSTTQDTVFDTVARPVVQDFLTGYNGTIFAYGQTGSGKTYTIEGGHRRFAERGLAPRALSAIYESLESRGRDHVTLHLSFLEIYQDVGYDLLNAAARTGSVVTPFPKVALGDVATTPCFVRNLSRHLAANEEVAQALLLQGQANRKVAATAMNFRSSRSHALLIIQLTVKEPDKDTVTRSKLHLVDLAGSERVSRTGSSGQILTEAKHINLSLHHLEHVILALHRHAKAQIPRPTKMRNSSPLCQPPAIQYNRWMESPGSQVVSGHMGHFVPYRNSLLTMVLRDSLGGNCKTAMVATISLDERHIAESVSTCRFAQRVASISNTVRQNVEMDDRAMVRRLQRRVAELEAELNQWKAGRKPCDTVGGDVPEVKTTETSGHIIDQQLTDEDKEACHTFVSGLFMGKSPNPTTDGVTSRAHYMECLSILRNIIVEGAGRGRQHSPSPTPAHGSSRLMAGSKEKTDCTEQTASEITFPQPGNTLHESGNRAPVKTMSEIATAGSSLPSKKEAEVKSRGVLQQQSSGHLAQQLVFQADHFRKIITELEHEISLARDELWTQRDSVQQLKRSGAADGTLEEARLRCQQLSKRLSQMKKRLKIVTDQKLHLEEQRDAVIGCYGPDVVAPPGECRSDALHRDTDDEAGDFRFSDVSREPFAQVRQQQLTTLTEQLKVKEINTRLKLKAMKEKLERRHVASDMKATPDGSAGRGRDDTHLDRQTTDCSVVTPIDKWNVAYSSRVSDPDKDRNVTPTDPWLVSRSGPIEQRVYQDVPDPTDAQHCDPKTRITPTGANPDKCAAAYPLMDIEHNDGVTMDKQPECRSGHVTNGTGNTSGQLVTTRESPPEMSTFDETLQRMLQTDVTSQTSYAHAHYDQFARESSNINWQGPKCSSSSRSGIPLMDKFTSKYAPYLARSRGRIGPQPLESVPRIMGNDKNASVSDRINALLEKEKRLESGDEKASSGLDPGRAAPQLMALGRDQREEKYLEMARTEQARVARIRRARAAALLIQITWRKSRGRCESHD